MELVFYDVVLLILFVIFVACFLFVKRRNLKTEGSFFLYKTKWGIKLINYVGKKYQRILHFLSYISIGLGCFLMVSILGLIIQSVYLYLTSPIAQQMKAPPIMPLIPYFPKLFGLESIFPPMYFIYFIITIVIVATVHEFAHGIFARRYNIKIKSTGFAFLKYFPALFGAFVEQDDKQMLKAKKFEQMSILAAGVFANVLVAILFFILLCWFFSFAFVASGVTFSTYSYSPVEISQIMSVNGIQLDNYSLEKVAALANETEFNIIKTGDKTYLGIRTAGVSDGKIYLYLYDDAPAINAGLYGAISKVNCAEIRSIQELSEELAKYSPEQKVNITTITSEGSNNYEIELKESPYNEGVAWLGIGFMNVQTSTLGKIYSWFSYKEPYVYYTPVYGKASTFVKDLLWWIFLINLLVALMNMLPAGFLDGGRFFYLAVLSVTKNEKFAKKSFAFATWFLLLLLLVLMAKWIFGFF